MPLPNLTSFTKLLGIDLGSSRVRFWHQDKGVVLDEPAAIAIDSRSGKVLAVGSEAQAMQGRVSAQIAIHRPVQAGAVHDLAVAQAMLKVFAQQVGARSFSLVSPVVMVSVPAGSTTMARENVVRVVEALGVREVYTIVQPLAAAIGSGVPIADSSGSFVLHAGGGMAEAAIISLGSVVAHRSTTQAGARLDRKLIATIKKQFSLGVSLETVQEVKRTLLTLDPTSKTERLVAGQDLRSGSPTELQIQGSQLLPVVTQYSMQYERILQQLLSEIPPQLTVDVIDKGLLLTGGLAKLQGLEAHLVGRMGIPVTLAEEPDLAVIKGIGIVLENLELFKQSLGYQV